MKSARGVGASDSRSRTTQAEWRDELFTTMNEAKTKRDTQAASTPARCSAAGSALADVEATLKLVKDSYIHDNKHRLGALGCADMDMVEEYLSSARGKLLNSRISNHDNG